MKKINYPVNGIKRSVKIALCLLFIFSTNVAYSQSKDTNKIPLEKINEYDISNLENTKREILFLSVLPDVIHDTTNDVLKIVSQHVTFESVTYYITNEDGFIFSSGELTLLKGDEKRVFISSLPAGTYNIILEIENEYFQGEFDVDTF